jgi:putative Holliday junction resolvase
MRILAIDLGKVRTGLALTDALGLTAQPYKTVETAKLFTELENICTDSQLAVGTIVLGYPTRLDGTPTHMTEPVLALRNRLTDRYPTLPVHLFDERFTTTLAQQALLQMGLKRTTRQQKSLTDTMSATLLLQSWLESQSPNV